MLSHVWLFATPLTVAVKASLSTEFSRQDYWTGSLFHTLGDLPDPGIEPESPALASGFFTTAPRENPFWALGLCKNRPQTNLAQRFSISVGGVIGKNDSIILNFYWNTWNCFPKSLFLLPKRLSRLWPLNISPYLELLPGFRPLSSFQNDCNNLLSNLPVLQK